MDLLTRGLKKKKKTFVKHKTRRTWPKKNIEGCAHDDGGVAPPASICNALNAELLFNLGETVGGLILATLMVSRLL